MTTQSVLAELEELISVIPKSTIRFEPEPVKSSPHFVRLIYKEFVKIRYRSDITSYKLTSVYTWNKVAGGRYIAR